MSIYEHADTYRHITPGQLARCMPSCPNPEEWARAFDDAIERFKIDDIAMLMAQVGHESADLTHLQENLNYSANRLIQVWPSRFPTVESAQPFARNPEGLANNVYGGRLGNTEPGDGWRFRGQGPIMITGRYNVTQYARTVGEMDVVDNPELLQSPHHGALSACWFYSANVPKWADTLTATQRINGGTHGLKDRENRYERCRMVIG